MLNKAPLNGIQRHPAHLLIAGRYTSVVEDHVPTPEMISKLDSRITPLMWGKRQVQISYPYEEFLIYDETVRRCIAQGPTELIAAAKALDCINYEALKPADFQPILQGMRFEKRTHRHIDKHQVLTSSGHLMAESDYKRSSCQLAAVHVAAQRHGQPMDVETFLTGTIFATVHQLGSRLAYEETSTNHFAEKKQLQDVLHSIWMTDTNAKSHNPNQKDFVQQIESAFFQTHEDNIGFKEITLTYQSPEPSKVRIVLAKNNFKKVNLLKWCFEKYQREFGESENSASAPRQRL